MPAPNLSCSKADLIAENTLLRHQLALLKRQAKRPKLNPSDRAHLPPLAKTFPSHCSYPSVVATNVIRAERRAYSTAGARHPNPRQWADAAALDFLLSSAAIAGQPAGKVIVGYLLLSRASPVLATLVDVTRTPAELIAENALLRHQLRVLRRQAKRPPTCEKRRSQELRH